jgi:hypothetical protein
MMILHMKSMKLKKNQKNLHDISWWIYSRKKLRWFIIEILIFWSEVYNNDCIVILHVKDNTLFVISKMMNIMN